MVRDASLAKGIEADLDPRCNLYTFGSYRLGVHGPAADIDTLCIGPRHLSRADYFGSEWEEFRGSFYEVIAHPGTDKIVAVPDAVVPELKLVFRGFEVDMAYTSLPTFVSVPEDLDVCQTSILQNLDDPSVKSLNGCRVADQLLRLVPNHDAFRTALRALRVWAKHRGVYSNVMGYFGGVNLAILVAACVPVVPQRRALHARLLFLPTLGRVAVDHARDAHPHRRRGPRSQGMGRAREQGGAFPAHEDHHPRVPRAKLHLQRHQLHPARAQG